MKSRGIVVAFGAIALVVVTIAGGCQRSVVPETDVVTERDMDRDESHHRDTVVPEVADHGDPEPDREVFEAIILTKASLAGIDHRIKSLCRVTHDPPPLENEAIVSWFVACDVPMHRFSVEDGRFVDGWCNELRIVEIADGVMQVGSMGPDGEWHEGGGDDIMGEVIVVDDFITSRDVN